MKIFSLFSQQKNDKKEIINYYHLKNSKERGIAFDNIISSLTFRISTNSNLKQFFVANDRVNYVTDILREMNDVVAVVWKDDLYDNHTYLHILTEFVKITKNPFPLSISKIKDNYLHSKDNTVFSFSFESKGKIYETALKKVFAWITTS